MTSRLTETIDEARDRIDGTIEHGGPDLRELHRLGVDPASLLDFSVCTNPYGPSPAVYDAVTRVSFDKYPDREVYNLRSALAERFELSPQHILAGNGASELIWLAALALVRASDRVLVIGPTYGEYARATSLHGGIVHAWNARPENRFGVRTTDIETELQRGQPRLVFLCNPNNPTGATIDPDAILSWARRYPRTMFVVDEAYQAFAFDLDSLIGMRENNLLILRSMTKDYALAGLRIGYAVGSEEVIDRLAHVRPPWSVNAMAQAAAVAALQDEAHLRRSLALLAQATTDFLIRLSERGFEAVPSATHFFVVHVGDGAAFRLALLRQGILVRDAASFGLPEFVRLATRRPEDNARLLAALDEGVRHGR